MGQLIFSVQLSIYICLKFVLISVLLVHVLYSDDYLYSGSFFSLVCVNDRTIERPILKKNLVIFK